MTDLIAGVAIKEFARFKPEIYFLTDDYIFDSEHKKAKCVNKNIVATMSHNE